MPKYPGNKTNITLHGPPLFTMPLRGYRGYVKNQTCFEASATSKHAT